MGPGRDIVRNKDMFASSKMKSPTSTTYHPIAYSNTRTYSIGERHQK